MRSRLEEQVAGLLDKLGIKYTYEADKLHYVLEANYIPDFKVGNIYLETKGYFPPDQRKKMLAVKKANPDADIRLVFITQLAIGVVRPMVTATTMTDMLIVLYVGIMSLEENQTTIIKHPELC